MNLSVYKSIYISIYSNHCCWYQILSNPVFIFLSGIKPLSIYHSSYLSMPAYLSLILSPYQSIRPSPFYLSIHPGQRGIKAICHAKLTPVSCWRPKNHFKAKEIYNFSLSKHLPPFSLFILQRRKGILK